MIGMRRTLSLLSCIALFLQATSPMLVGSAPSLAAVQDSIPPYPLTPKDAVQLQCDQLVAPPDELGDYQMARTFSVATKLEEQHILSVINRPPKEAV